MLQNALHVAHGKMYKEQEFDLSVRCRWLPDDESRDASRKYALQNFKTRNSFIFSTDDYFLRRDDPRCAILMLGGITKFARYT